MNIIAKSSNISTPVELYKLVQSPDRRRLTDAKGAELELASWVLYEKPDKNGNAVKLLALSTADGNTYCTNSGTFCQSFESAVEMFSQFRQEFHTIRVIVGTSKSGREYIDCVVVG